MQVRYSREVIVDFISPPYDFISPDERTRLQKLSPFNISPIFGLFDDDKHVVVDMCKKNSEKISRVDCER
ncbi:MAG: hypothetical protein LE178_01315 [Endomicrobium sp.]|nr:hypothetical protein [Endomicrobium sp.]